MKEHVALLSYRHKEINIADHQRQCKKIKEISTSETTLSTVNSKKTV